MKLRHIFACVIASSLTFSSAFAASTTNDTNTSNQTTNAATKPDAEALGWLITVDKNEITLGKLAKEKSKNKDVIAFANLMIKEHSKNMQEAEKLGHQLKIKPAMHDQTVADMKKTGEEEKTNLKTMTGTDFEKNYIQAMVDGHAKVLKAIQDNYLNTVNNASVKNLFETTQTHVEHHLAEAKKIQGDLAS